LQVFTVFCYSVSTIEYPMT